MEKESGRRNRTRTGCLRCRQRKIRCDEGKPSCQRCIRIQVECPGYEERTRLFGLRTDECFTSDFEKACYLSFMSVGVQDLVLFRPSFKEFWKTIVPQLADIHPTVRHAVIAIAVVQEPKIRPNLQSQEDVRATAYSHFNKAIRGFLESGVSFATIHKLTCCLLFNELMKILEMVPAGGEHIKAARSILEEHERALINSEVEFDPVIASTFAPIVLHYTLDAVAFLDGFEVREDVFQQNEDVLLHIPATLSGFGEAIEIMDTLIKYAIMFHQGRSGVPKQTIEVALAKFDRLLESLEADSGIRQHLSALRIHQRVAVCLIERDPGLHLLKEVVEISEDISHIDWGPKLGTIPPLLFTALNCRDKTLRERAMDHLHNLRISEGAITSCMAIRLAVSIEPRTALVIEDASLPTATDQGSEQGTLPLEDQWKIGGLIKLQQRVVQAYGYSGILCFTSKIDCDCPTEAIPLVPR